MKPYKTYAVGSNLYTYGDNSIQKTTLKVSGIVDSCATLEHIWLLDSTWMLWYGDIDSCGNVSNVNKCIHMGLFSQLSPMFNHVYLLTSTGHILKAGPDIKTIVSYEEDNMTFCKIACGSGFMIALTDDGKVYRRGKWFDGSFFEKPQCFATDVVDIACGDFHCILLQENGWAVSHGESDYCFEPVGNVTNICAIGKSSLLSGVGFNKYYGGRKS